MMKSQMKLKELTKLLTPMMVIASMKIQLKWRMVMKRAMKEAL